MQPGEKVRWEFGPKALPRDADVDARVREFAGKVPLRARHDTMPLFGGL